MTKFPSRLVVYMAGAGVPQYLGIIEALLRQEESVEKVDFVVGDRPSFQVVQALPVCNPKIQFRYQHESFDPFNRQQPLDYRRLVELEERYGLPNLWRYIHAQRIIEDSSEAQKLAYLQAYVEYFESLAHETKAGVFISGTPDSLPFMVGSEVFRRNGCATVAMAPGRLPQRFFVVMNELEQIRGLAEEYERLRLRNLTQEEMQIVQNLRAAYVRKRVRPPYYRLRSRLSAVPSLIRFLLTLRRRLVDDDRYFDYPLRTIAKRSMMFRVRGPIQRRALERLTTSPIEHEKYFYMPLNYEPECSIDVQSGFYRDQVSIVQRVIGGLPTGYVLYVKEHPNMLPGARPLGFYQRLTDLGSVRIMPREMDSYEILQQCTGVVTIGGTTGVEALFYGKPVLLLGHAFYEVFREGVLRAVCFEDIPRMLRAMVDDLHIDNRSFDRFITAVLAKSYPGIFELTAVGAMESSSYETIARGVAQEIRSQLSSA